MKTKQIESDFLIIGSGIAGLTFAIKASTLGSVALVTKKQDFESNTNYAQGGIASVLSSDDSFEEHIEDTLKAGSHLNNVEAVNVLVKEGPERIEELIQWGTNFSMDKTGSEENLDLTKEGGHSHSRIAHAADLTGKEIEEALLKKVSEIKNIITYENHTVIDLLTEHQLGEVKDSDINCYGAYILDNSSGVVVTYLSKFIFLATGGAGQVYEHTTNPGIATGDGIAMAYRAGALISDMEFIQFHPTSLFSNNISERSFLISEAVRGDGAILLNSQGKRFMDGVHPLKDLAPRDVVAQTIDLELKRLGDSNVFLDISFKDKDFLLNRFPNIYAKCLSEGIDISKEPIPVVPAAHYLCGGIISDINGKTSIKNLFVSGESSCTGVHGANRLASNSLLEAVVFSNRAFKYISEIFNDEKNRKIPNFPDWDKEGTFDLEESILIQHNIEDVKRLMWDYVGIIRSDLRLERAYKRIIMLAEEIHSYYLKSTISPRIIELRNLATVAKLIIKGAMTRPDSIGLHFNINHPETREEKVNIVQKSRHNPMIKKSGSYLWQKI